MAERLVSVSLMPPRISNTAPMTINAIVWGSDPETQFFVRYGPTRHNVKRRTAGLAKIEPKEYTDYPAHYQTQSNEVKFSYMLSEWSSLVWIKVQEYEQDNYGYSTSRQVDPKAPRT